MKKLIKVILILSSLLAFVISGADAAFFDDAERSKYADDIRLLCNLGIVNGDENGNFNPDNSVNRVEFLTIVLRTLYDDTSSYLSAGNQYAFDDVSPEHWAYNEVCFMRMMGLTEGIGDNKFGPDATISLKDAVKIIITAAGYGEVAEQRGGYPDGYLQIAYSIGLMDKANAKNGEAMTRAEVAHFIAGALDVKENTDERTTLLERRRYTQLEGVVEAVFDLQMGKSLEEGQIQLGGEVYETDVKIFPCSQIELVGRRVVVYYSPSDEKIIHIALKGKQNGLVIESRKIVGTPTVSEYKYKDENGKTRTAKISNGVVIKNGELLPSGLINSSVLKPPSGEVNLLDTDGNSVYDIIYVRSYELCTVSANREDIIYGRLGNQIDLKDVDVVHVYDGDVEVSISDIKPDDVISVMKSPSGEKVWIYISRETAEGKIQTIGKDRDTIIYEIDGEDRYLTNEYKNKMNSSYGVSMNLGDYRKIYLDIYGEIAFAEAVEAEEEYPNYAYLMQVDTSSGSFTRAAVVKLLTMNNKIEYFEIPNNEKIRFGRLTGGSYKVSKEDGDEVATQLRSYVKKLITYEYDDDFTLTKVCVPGVKNDRENLSEDVPGNHSATYQNKVIDNKYYVDADTACFGIPFSGNYKEYIQAGQYNDILVSGKNNVCLYDVEPDGRVGAVICSSTVTERYTESKGEYEVILDYVNSPILFVNEVISMRDEDDNFETYAVGYQLGQEVKVPIGNKVNVNSESLDIIKPGVAIQYETNSLELSRAATSEESKRIIIVKKVFDFTENNPYKTTYAYNDNYYNRVAGVSATSLSGLVCTYDRIKDVSSAAIILEKSGFSIQKNNGITVMSYNRSTGEFELAAIEDLQIGMEIFTRRRNSNAIEIVYMKD